MIAPLQQSALVVLGSVLIEPDGDTRRRRAQWLGTVDAVVWPDALHRVLATAFAAGADDVPTILESTFAELPEAGVWKALELIATACDVAQAADDHWREHAELVLAAARVERARLDLIFADHRLGRHEAWS